MTKIGSIAVILTIFIFTYAIMGMELFSHKLRFDYTNKPVNYFATFASDVVSPIHSVPDSNFDSILNATTAVFIVLANDGWSTIYFDYYRTSGAVVSTVFFISLLVLGQTILFNLFLSILLKEFDSLTLM